MSFRRVFYRDSRIQKSTRKTLFQSSVCIVVVAVLEDTAVRDPRNGTVSPVGFESEVQQLRCLWMHDRRKETLAEFLSSLEVEANLRRGGKSNKVLA
jgi:hypothetical protein